jgi:hypothetical protein
MIYIEIWTEDGIDIDGPSMSAEEIKHFVDLLKEYGVWIEGERYEFKAGIYHAENRTFEITVE